jgi:6-phosphogluconolactonase
MRLLIPLAALALLTGRLSADTALYVSVAGAKRIALYKINPDTGKLTHQADTATAGEPGALTVDPDKRFLFAAIRSAGKLSAFRIGAGGKLTPVNTVPAGADPAHIATDRSGRFLLTAYYVAAKVTVHAVGKDGALSKEPVQTVRTADKAHAIVPDPFNRFVFVPHTGPNAIFQFAFRPRTGKLTPGSVPRLKTPDKTGPRHLAFHPKKDIAYVVNEQGSSVTAYKLDTKSGTLTAVQTVPTLPRGYKGSNSTAEIKVHPTGKFLYASNRGHDSIACFALDKCGRLSALLHIPTEQTPRSFDLSPDGKFLYAAGESSGKVAGYRIDARTGGLKRLGAAYAVGKTPWWVLAVELPKPRTRGSRRF